MTKTIRKGNPTMEAIQSYANKHRNDSALAMYEYQLISCNARMKVWKHTELKEMYDRWGNAHGATKAVHTFAPSTEEHNLIVIKRFHFDGWCSDPRYEHKRCTGNQLIDEINCWLEFEEKEESDYLAPIFQYFKSKSDKVEPCDETMLENVLIVAQKASDIGDLEDACIAAQRRNDEQGLIGEDWYPRFAKMKAFAKKMGWRDVVNNPGNSGVIFDYSKGCYKAVFIDYAL